MKGLVSEDAVRLRVSRGAALLDRLNPGWEMRVDDSVKISCSQSCVFAQVFGIQYSCIRLQFFGIGDATGLGFQAFNTHGGEPEEYALLKKYWLEERDARMRT